MSPGHLLTRLGAICISVCKPCPISCPSIHKVQSDMSECHYLTWRAMTSKQPFPWVEISEGISILFLSRQLQKNCGLSFALTGRREGRGQDWCFRFLYRISCFLRKCYYCILSLKLTWLLSSESLRLGDRAITAAFHRKESFTNPLWHSSLNLGELE